MSISDRRGMHSTVLSATYSNFEAVYIKIIDCDFEIDIVKIIVILKIGIIL